MLDPIFNPFEAIPDGFWVYQLIRARINQRQTLHSDSLFTANCVGGNCFTCPLPESISGKSTRIAVSFLKRIRTHVRAEGLGSADLSQSGRIWPNLFHPPISLRLCVCSWRVGAWATQPPRLPPVGADADSHHTLLCSNAAQLLYSAFFENENIIMETLKATSWKLSRKHSHSHLTFIKMLVLTNLPWK